MKQWRLGAHNTKHHQLLSFSSCDNEKYEIMTSPDNVRHVDAQPATVALETDANINNNATIDDDDGEDL